MQMVSLALTFISITNEVFMSEYLQEFIAKFTILIICCVCEFIFIIIYMESEDKRSDYIKELFPVVRWDRTLKWLTDNYAYFIVAGVILMILACRMIINKCCDKEE